MTRLDKSLLTKKFDEIYELDAWTNGSGPGSIPQANRPLISFLNEFMELNAVRSIVDFGCGDRQFMSSVELGGRNYTGYDVSEFIVHTNRQKIRRQNVRFDFTPDDLSIMHDADLYVFKDVLIHLPNTYVCEVLSHAIAKSKYVICINNQPRERDACNEEIEPGSFRPVDVTAEPLSFKAATVLRYGRDTIWDPRMPYLVARILRRTIHPGVKHVQLILGSK